MKIFLREKEGNGIGSHLAFENKDHEYMGNLTFHEGRDWQVTDSTRTPEFGWEPFEKALKLARKKHPKG